MNKISKNLLYVFFISFISYLIPSTLLLAEGFVVGTVVATPIGKVPIEQLKVGDLVVSYNFDTAKLETTYIANIFKKKTQSITQLSIGSDTIEVDDDHKFYCPLSKEQWVDAHNLQERHFLLKGLTEVVRITTIAPLQKEAEVYYLTLANNHNFFVSKQEILVHNFAIPLIGAAIAWLVENFVFTVGVSILGIGAGVIMSQADSNNQQKPQCDVYLQYENKHGFLQKEENKSDDAQAPGMPTENDGYVPPKKWDGKKVKNQNGKGGVGWPDKDGNVWVPTGPKGHGGPHWDVQFPSGGYKNVLPGGKVRGQK